MDCVQRIGSARDIVNIGQVGSGRVGDGRVDDGRLGGLAGGGHALGGQRRNGNDRVVPVGDDLCADLVQRRGVVLAVEVLVLDCDALLSGFGVQLFFNGNADLVKAGMVKLLYHGDLVALGGGIRRAFCGGGGRLGSGRGNGGSIGSGTAGGQRGHHSGSGQNSNKLFHGTISLICKYQIECVFAGGEHCSPLHG